MIELISSWAPMAAIITAAIAMWFARRAAREASRDAEMLARWQAAKTSRSLSLLPNQRLTNETSEGS